ncbi:uncharacterized protein LACBIDRAFT_332551 [Laccaria bicolor S238N-H82]|uniref:Predicted protein n=1 Tax=Laccaria bicolor (strain S238N-H82 / ATCC MYA-4686) TaxID=486041 RepID=B0DT40_LACBS|nr:uncharacterized protein LACBIDRAFT_332551 [Laccaria bicolor S238N-H82]EDR02155.1 predicted protein [Laccaria bicolor S238N-H82]|eukprot:XP_001887100.1 predicted protein [Laccaria bicolor S238N-H82]
MWVADDNEFGLDPGSEWYKEAMEGDVMEDRGPPEVQKKKKKARSRLSLLHLLALTTKGSTYDFYRTLEKLTSNTGLSMPTSRYQPLLWMVLQFRHLKMLKRGGVGHDPAGVEGVGEGALGLSCPHCPRPGVNLPDGWDKAPESLRFLYFLTYSMDANFCLKNQLVSSFSSDPGLGIGMAYMVPREGYDSYVLSWASDADISTCVGFQALAKANSKFSRGLRFTGVGAVSCARSEMVLPTCVRNLQKGERYANMDYIFGRAIHDVSPNIPVVIPAFHEPGHGQRKHQEYSFKLSWGMGLTNGEGCEQIWAANNALGNATKMQGPGSRQDVIDNHLGFWNWLKYCGMGKTLMKKYRTAIRQRNVQVEGHRGFTNTLPKELAAEWTKLCKDWDRATYTKQAENLFITRGLCLTEAEIQKEFAAEEESLLVGGAPALHSTTMSSFMVLALDLEDSQQRLCELAKSRESGRTPGQAALLTELRNVLRAKIKHWEQIRGVYMPGLQRLQLEQERTNSKTLRAGHFQPPPASNHPEHVDLWLPSSLSSPSHVSVCSARLIAIEEKLRTESLRHVLRVKSQMILFKNKTSGVREMVHARAWAAAAKYRLARLAKLSLSGPGAWESTLRVLLDSDIRAYSDPEKMRVPVGWRGTLEHESEEVEESGPSNTQAREIDLRPEIRGRRDGTGDTQRTLSWIWQMDGFAVSGEDAEDDILRSEWAKSRARANRAEEEVLLV